LFGGGPVCGPLLLPESVDRLNPLQPTASPADYLIEMSSPSLGSALAADAASRRSELCTAQLRVQRTHLDYLFTGFLLYEWLLALTVTVWLSRHDGISLTVAMRHQYEATLALGILLAIIPAILVWIAPGRQVTRCTIAVAQLLFSALLIHLTMWRLGLHFHILASLLFLAFYRDAWVMVSAAAAAVAELAVGGWPALASSGFATDSRWRTVEHAGWVIFGALFVLDARREAIRAIRKLADRETELRRDLQISEQQAGRDFSAKVGLLAAAGRALRAPVESVLGMTSLLLDSVMNPTQERVARSIQGSGELLLATVNDVLDLATVDSGQAKTDPVPCNLQVVISQAVDWLDYAARQKNLRLWVKYPPQCPRRFVADRARIRQVLLNLLNNAVRCTEYGGITISVEAVGTFGDETTVRITVTDTGVGMSEEQLARVFELFSPVSSPALPAAARTGTTGLGLALSKRLVSLLGGEMGVSSKPGVGSQFWFTMRLKRDAQRSTQRGEHAELTEVRILVVDQVPANRQILTEVLSQWGCRAECASPALAVERMGEAQRSGDPFRMMLAGQRMTEHDAESLAVAIKSDPYLRDAVLVMVAANPTPQGCRQSLKVGFTEYIEHPSGISGIYDGLVRAWREASQAPAAMPSFAAPAQPQLPPPDPARPQVLVVDDNAKDSAALARMLEELGCQAETAANGVQAVEMWSARPYDLVLMDCEMPEMDGFDAAAEIRQLEQPGSGAAGRPAHTPIIAMMDASAGTSRMKCVANGMDDCMAKPVSRALLKRALTKFTPTPVLVPVRRS
jgi:two-component system, sensor histidine kinase and response regulator